MQPRASRLLQEGGLSDVPEIITYCSDDAPKSERWISFFRTTKTLPMRFTGHTKEAVVIAADAWWKAEAAKEAVKKERIARMSESRRSL